MSDIAMTHRLLRIHLSSWRYFALLTLPPLVLAGLLAPSWLSGLLLALFLLTHYHCWRLFLDERLFRLLASENDLPAFDAAMAQLWSTRPGPTRPLAARWRGVRRLFYRAMLTLLALWLVTLFAAI